MARSNTAPAQETNPPDFLAWHVANKGEKGFWTRVVPPRPQGVFASVGSGADQWPDRLARAAGGREKGAGRLAPGFRTKEDPPGAHRREAWRVLLQPLYRRVQSPATSRFELIAC